MFSWFFKISFQILGMELFIILIKKKNSASEVISHFSSYHYLISSYYPVTSPALPQPPHLFFLRWSHQVGEGLAKLLKLALALVMLLSQPPVLCLCFASLVHVSS